MCHTDQCDDCGSTTDACADAHLLCNCCVIIRHPSNSSKATPGSFTVAALILHPSIMPGHPAVVNRRHGLIGHCHDPLLALLGQGGELAPGAARIAADSA